MCPTSKETFFDIWRHDFLQFIFKSVLYHIAVKRIWWYVGNLGDKYIFNQACNSKSVFTLYQTAQQGGWSGRRRGKVSWGPPKPNFWGLNIANMQSKSQLTTHFLLINACVTCQTIKLINCQTNFIPATFCAFKGGRILNPFFALFAWWVSYERLVCLVLGECA